MDPQVKHCFERELVTEQVQRRTVTDFERIIYREKGGFPLSFLTVSLYSDAIFFLNFRPVYTFGVHWVGECGGGIKQINLCKSISHIEIKL
jgi:hypothetical protein